jgi:hypothetical protein
MEIETRIKTNSSPVPQQIHGDNQPANIARIVSSAIDGVLIPPVENINIQNAQNVKVFVQINENPTYFSRFLQGAATSAGGTIMAIVIFKVAGAVAGAWNGAAVGAATGPAGALAGAFVGGTIGLIV